MAGIVIRPRARILQGHDWVYGSEILKVFGQPADGDVVSIKDGRDRMLGTGIYNSRVSIVVRRFSRIRQVLDLSFFEQRIRRAWEDRLRSVSRQTFCRVVWSEADGLPGVVVDLYGRTAVLQILTAGMDVHRGLIVDALVKVLPVDSVVERSESSSRRKEGLADRTEVLHGTNPGVIECESGGMVFLIDPLQGQKTGMYLDQIENYPRVADHARGRSVLDCFSNQGGFAMACARAGASEVIAVESGEQAVDSMRKNCEKNALSIRIERGDVFAHLNAFTRQGRQFGLVILDPPSFAHGRSGLRSSLRAYRDLHQRAAAVLEPNAVLATFTCSHHVTAEPFLDCLREAFQSTRMTFRIMDELRQPADHPVLLTIPETAYLRGWILKAEPR